MGEYSDDVEGEVKEKCGITGKYSETFVIHKKRLFHHHARSEYDYKEI